MSNLNMTLDTCRHYSKKALLCTCSIYNGVLSNCLLISGKKFERIGDFLVIFIYIGGAAADINTLN